MTFRNSIIKKYYIFLEKKIGKNPPKFLGGRKSAGLDEPASGAGVKVLQILIDVLVAVGAAEVGHTAVRVEPEVLRGSIAH